METPATLPTARNLRKAKSFTPKIESDIPLPPDPPRKPKGPNVGQRIIWPFGSMSVGDSMAVPEWCDEKRAYAAIYKAQTLDGRVPSNWEFVIKETTQGFRIWRIA